jgi:amidase
LLPFIPQPEVIWNAEFAAGAEAGGQMAEAQAAHALLFADVEAFFGTYDLLITPAVIVQPYDVNIRYPSRAADVSFGNCEWRSASRSCTVVLCLTQRVHT